MAKYCFYLLCLYFSGLCLSVESVQVDDVVVRYKATPELPGHAAVLEVYLKGREHQMSYHQLLYGEAELKDAAVYGNKLIIMLKRSNTYHIMLFDKLNGNVLDSFWSGFTQISPTGRFIVFTKWTGRNQVTPWGRTVGVTAIYDLEKTAKDNRTKQEQQILANVKQPFVSPSRSVGIPILPHGDHNQPEYGWSHSMDDSVIVMSGYHWYKSDAVFFMVKPHKGFVRMADAIYDEKTNQFKVDLYQLPTSKFGPEYMGVNQYPTIRDVKKIGDRVKFTTLNRVIRLNLGPGVDHSLN